MSFLGGEIVVIYIQPIRRNRYIMEFRQLGGSGFKVPALCLGTGTFGAKNEFFRAFGEPPKSKKPPNWSTSALEAGLNMFDSADVYSDGAPKKILGKAIKGRRDQVIISTKATFRSGSGDNDVGSSRHHLIKACEGSLRRLGTDYIDLYQMHGFDALTPVEETLGALDDMVHSGKVRYIGCSNFSGWHLMKSLAVSEKYGLSRYVAHQAYYSLVGRHYEWELMPLALDQKVGTVVWSPLGWGRLTGKIRRGQPLPETSRLHSQAIVDAGPPIADEYVYSVVDAIDEVAEETGKTVPQIAINWLLQRPTVATVIIGARNADQLRQNLGAVGWNLTPAQLAKLDAASATTPDLSLLASKRFHGAKSAGSVRRHTAYGIRNTGCGRRKAALRVLGFEIRVVCGCLRRGPGFRELLYSDFCFLFSASQPTSASRLPLAFRVKPPKVQQPGKGFAVERAGYPILQLLNSCNSCNSFFHEPSHHRHNVTRPRISASTRRKRGGCFRGTLLDESFDPA